MTAADLKAILDKVPTDTNVTLIGFPISYAHCDGGTLDLVIGKPFPDMVDGWKCHYQDHEYDDVETPFHLVESYWYSERYASSIQASTD